MVDRANNWDRVMPLPDLSCLTIGSRGGKRLREERSESRVMQPTDEEQHRAWQTDSSNWQKRVCEVWNGQGEDGYRSYRKVFSPDGDWKKRSFDVRAELSTGFLGGVSCVVVRNIHGFEPNGVHFADMQRVRDALKAHYDPKTDPVPYDTLPPGKHQLAVHAPVWNAAQRRLPLRLCAQWPSATRC